VLLIFAKLQVCRRLNTYSQRVMFWPTVLALLQLAADVRSDEFVLGYLTGSRRRPGDIGYSKPGRTISGAISLAVEEINSGSFKDKGMIWILFIDQLSGKKNCEYNNKLFGVQPCGKPWLPHDNFYVILSSLRYTRKILFCNLT